MVKISIDVSKYGRLPKITVTAEDTFLFGTVDKELVTGVRDLMQMVEDQREPEGVKIEWTPEAAELWWN